LGRLGQVTERIQRALFDPARLAPDPGSSALTPEGKFPKYKVAETFPEAPADFRLSVRGLVARPLNLSLSELLGMPRTPLRCRHHCVEGWSAVAAWEGVRLSQLAELVGAHPAARYVVFRSFERDPEGVEYSSCWDQASALHPQTLLAHGRNGGPLSREYGGPVRLYGAVKLGYKMVKWVREVEFTDQRAGGYWEDQGYEWWAGV
jgi:DMSO/TMAO reductase YedYZ molybdopterin-dependent catalytic subunit